MLQSDGGFLSKMCQINKIGGSFYILVGKC
jgi:hypothetical protein